jgi:hypothetical protein
MKSGENTAFPADAHTHTDGGLTKREYFAALALQGFASKRDHTIDDDYIRTARASIKLADALIAQLDKQQEQ